MNGFQNSGRDYFLQIARGKVPGYTLFEEFGRNPDIDIVTAPEDIWNGGSLYTGFPAQSETMEIFSSSASDTALGIGARTVTITNLLDSTGASMPDVTVSLNGLTPVSLGTSLYHRASRIEVQTAGTSGSNVGTLTLRHTTTITNIFAVMPIGAGRTHILAYTVPLGFTLYMKLNVQMGRANGAAGSANVTLRVLHAITDAASHTHVSAEITQSQSYPPLAGNLSVFDEKTDIVMRVESVSDNNTIVTGNFNGILIDNSLLD